MSTEKVKATYQLSKTVADTIKAMSDFTKKPVDTLVETALKFFIATHNDYLGRTHLDRDEGAERKKD